MPRDINPPSPLPLQTTTSPLSQTVLLAREPVMAEAARAKEIKKLFIVAEKETK